MTSDFDKAFQDAKRPMQSLAKKAWALLRRIDPKIAEVVWQKQRIVGPRRRTCSGDLRQSQKFIKLNAIRSEMPEILGINPSMTISLLPAISAQHSQHPQPVIVGRVPTISGNRKPALEKLPPTNH